jgi:dephospho-CoA kinase
MIRVGITGGIGTGKSTIAKIFKSMGIPFLDADVLAKEIVERDVQLKQAIIDTFGTASYTEEGAYNRKYIAGIVFNDKEKLAELNALVHPAVIKYGNDWAEEHRHSKYILKEAALMFESGSYKHNDINILVLSPLELRLQRIEQRDGIAREEILKRIQAQMPEEEKAAMSDKIILNDEQHSLIEQVMAIHNELMQDD